MRIILHIHGVTRTLSMHVEKGKSHVQFFLYLFSFAVCILFSCFGLWREQKVNNGIATKPKMAYHLGYVRVFLFIYSSSLRICFGCFLVYFQQLNCICLFFENCLFCCRTFDGEKKCISRMDSDKRMMIENWEWFVQYFDESVFIVHNRGGTLDAICSKTFNWMWNKWKRINFKFGFKEFLCDFVLN